MFGGGQLAALPVGPSATQIKQRLIVAGRRGGQRIEGGPVVVAGIVGIAVTGGHRGEIGTGAGGEERLAALPGKMSRFAEGGGGLVRFVLGGQQVAQVVRQHDDHARVVLRAGGRQRVAQHRRGALELAETTAGHAQSVAGHQQRRAVRRVVGEAGSFFEGLQSEALLSERLVGGAEVDQDVDLAAEVALGDKQFVCPLPLAERLVDVAAVVGGLSELEALGCGGFRWIAGKSRTEQRGGNRQPQAQRPWDDMRTNHRNRIITKKSREGIPFSFQDSQRGV